MSWFTNLKINTKFNLIMSLLLISLFLIAAYLTYERQQTLILKVAVDNARTIAKQIIETRDYMSSVVHDEPSRNYALVPQVVATQVAKRMTKGSPYYVRQVSLRYRNPENRPDEYETGLLKQFATKAVKESYDVVKVKGERTFRYLLPMVAEKSCLECHGTYDEAPQFIRERFPRGHYSYNYKVGEVVGAVSVRIPMTELFREIGTNLKLDLLIRGGIFFIMIFIMASLVRRAIINPIRSVSEAIANVTKTGNFSERIPQVSKDEVGQLIGSFNEMMEELERKTLQRMESEDRYRKFIEMTQSAVVTFLENGKIVISNRKAEELFGLSKQELLGESIFNYMEDGERLKQGIAVYLREGKGGGVGETTHHQVKDTRGRLTDVEMALSASRTDHKPLFTAILHEIRSEK
ncbi:MAG: putative PAS/PAC sensor [Geobacteraceae bacterium]|nr:MAG: putative PAS/PAC sensor [Geobacteraceae bacterium]